MESSSLNTPDKKPFDSHTTNVALQLQHWYLKSNILLIHLKNI